MGIKEDAVSVLVSLANYGQTPDDPNRGIYDFVSKELPDLVGLPPNRINDAVGFLESRRYVTLRKFLGTHPFTFGTIKLTTEGRLAAENYTGAPQAHETDPLLSLLNRGKFELELPRILSQHQNTKISVALCMLDIDYFKSFNDNHGHQSGDKVLQNTAAVLRNIVGTKGTCYRYGGEELSVILPNYTRAEVEPLAERIRAEIENSPVDELPRVTVSIGVALTENTRYEPQILVKAADGALYRAKESGRNRVVIA